MRNVQITCIVIVEIFLLSACSSILTVQSSPSDSVVSITSTHPIYKDKKPLIIGKTPIQSKSSLVQSSFPQGPYLIQVEKEGYETQSFLIPDISAADLSLNLQMSQRKVSTKINVLIDQLFRAQSLTHKGEYQAALDILSTLEKEYSEVSAIYELKASIFVLLKNTSAAITSLEQALKLNPENEEAKNFYRILTKDRTLGSLTKEVKL